MNRPIPMARFCLGTLAMALAACSSTASTDGCATPLPGDTCLDMSQAGGLSVHLELITQEVSSSLAAVRPLIDVDGVRIAIIADPGQVIPEIGLGGFNPGTHEVRIFGDPARPDLEAVLRAELAPQLAHELHHAARRRAVGYGSTLREAAVSEGLADHFSLEVTDREPPPWTTGLSPEELDVWLPEVVAASSGTYDHSKWFFGTDTIPRWTGYAVGFEIVRRYLVDNPGTLPSGLVGTPAADLVDG